VDSSSRFVPGAVVPRSGVYRVHHYAHRMPHFVTITAGTVFPECKRCGGKVTFVPMLAAEPINMDVDFTDQDFAA
jgi:C4-type Zn-finger protein